MCLHLVQITLQTHSIYISPHTNKQKPQTKDCSGNVSSCLVSCQPSDITDSNILCRKTDKQKQLHTIGVVTAVGSNRQKTDASVTWQLQQHYTKPPCAVVGNGAFYKNILKHNHDITSCSHLCHCCQQEHTVHLLEEN